MYGLYTKTTQQLGADGNVDEAKTLLTAEENSQMRAETFVAFDLAKAVADGDELRIPIPRLKKIEEVAILGVALPKNEAGQRSIGANELFKLKGDGFESNYAVLICGGDVAIGTTIKIKAIGE